MWQRKWHLYHGKNLFEEDTLVKNNNNNNNNNNRYLEFSFISKLTKILNVYLEGYML